MRTDSNLMNPIFGQPDKDVITSDGRIFWSIDSIHAVICNIAKQLEEGGPKRALRAFSDAQSAVLPPKLHRTFEAATVRRMLRCPKYAAFLDDFGIDLMPSLILAKCAGATENSIKTSVKIFWTKEEVWKVVNAARDIVTKSTGKDRRYAAVIIKAQLQVLPEDRRRNFTGNGEQVAGRLAAHNPVFTKFMAKLGLGAKGGSFRLLAPIEEIPIPDTAAEPATSTAVDESEVEVLPTVLPPISLLQQLSDLRDKMTVLEGINTKLDRINYRLDRQAEDQEALMELLAGLSTMIGGSSPKEVRNTAAVTEQRKRELKMPSRFDQASKPLHPVKPPHHTALDELGKRLQPIRKNVVRRSAAIPTVMVFGACTQDEDKIHHRVHTFADVVFPNEGVPPHPGVAVFVNLPCHYPETCEKVYHKYFGKPGVHYQEAYGVDDIVSAIEEYLG